MRALYEGYALTLSDYLCMPLPPWMADQPHKDNWLTVAKLRAQTEAADAGGDTAAARIAGLGESHHDF
jgi:hypothetical protein